MSPVDMLKLINYTFFSILMLSCNDVKKENNLIIEKEKRQDISSEIKLKEDSINKNEFMLNFKKISSREMFLLERKIESNQNLTEKDYGNLSFLISNLNDEAESENLGYLLFKYFEKNDLRNDTYLNMLNKLSKNHKEKILITLVKLMCIDFQDDNYSLEELQKNFLMFRGNSKVIMSFKECMGNKVD